MLKDLFASKRFFWNRSRGTDRGNTKLLIVWNLFLEYQTHPSSGLDNSNPIVIKLNRSAAADADADADALQRTMQR